jgi:hypothetical protein
MVSANSHNPNFDGWYPMIISHYIPIPPCLLLKSRCFYGQISQSQYYIYSIYSQLRHQSCLIYIHTHIPYHTLHYIALHYHYITITLPFHYHYITITLQLHTLHDITFHYIPCIHIFCLYVHIPNIPYLKYPNNHHALNARFPSLVIFPLRAM